MIIKLYKNKSDAKVISKDITDVVTKNFNFKDVSDILHPLVEIQGLITESNYAYIPDLKRFYFIDNVDIDNTGVCIYHLSIDVLMSYRQELLNKYFLISRQEFNYNPYFVDTELLTRADKTIINVPIGTVGTEDTYNYYLVTTGGN